MCCISGKSKYRRALNPSSTLLQFLDESAEWLSSWQILSADGRVLNGKFKFVDGWMQDIAGVKRLVAHLCSNNGFSYLFTRRLCSDPLENLVSIFPLLEEMLNYCFFGGGGMVQFVCVIPLHF